MPNFTGVNARPRLMTGSAAFQRFTCGTAAAIVAAALQPIENRRQHVALDDLAVMRDVAVVECRTD